MTVFQALVPLLLQLVIFSPVLAGIVAAWLYARHRHAYPGGQRRVSVFAYVGVLLACAVIFYIVGVVSGIGWACPSYGNLCGLFGFLAVGPLASTCSILVGAWLMTLSPTDRRGGAKEK